MPPLLHGLFVGSTPKSARNGSIFAIAASTSTATAASAAASAKGAAARAAATASNMVPMTAAASVAAGLSGAILVPRGGKL